MRAVRGVEHTVFEKKMQQERGGDAGGREPWGGGMKKVASE